MVHNPKNEYKKRKEHYDHLKKQQARAADSISNFRFATFIIGAGSVFFFYNRESYQISVIVALLFSLGFLWLVIKHQTAIDKKNHSEALYQINDKSLKRLDGKWKSFDDIGEEFIDEDHSYAQDLDIFGKGSLFQWINSTTTFAGRWSLKKILSGPCQTASEIASRQQAIQELAGKLRWRQEFLAQGMLREDGMNDPQSLYDWAMEKNTLLPNSWLILLVRILPGVTMALVLLVFLGYLSYFVPLVTIGVQIGLLAVGNKDRARLLETAYKYKSDLKTYSGLIKVLEEEKFSSSKLKELQQQLFNQEQQVASEQMLKLEKVVDAISQRYSQLYIIINILFLWDYQCQISLELWRDRSGHYLDDWIESIGDLEALSSLAVIKYDNPTWVMPEISRKPFIITAECMAHPLLGEEGICNDLQVDPQSRILLITGSNMSGKSTLLRTVGLNIVLAYLGTPVNAKKFICSQMSIYTCMRVSDNLEQNISSFYAELIRIKRIVKANERGEQLFFLLDEIFKGTNSRDRHTGAKVLINKLSMEGACGMVSTHDLELGDLEGENNRIKNFHFEEYYQNDELHFDYKLLPGLSTTRNAIYLMKMAGIEINEHS